MEIEGNMREINPNIHYFHINDNEKLLKIE